MRLSALPMLHLVWPIILLSFFLVWRLSAKQRLREKFIAPQWISELAPTYHPGREKRKVFLMISVLVLAMLALLRPQWGFEWQEVKREGINVLVAIDTSRSMLTQDVKPNRLERAKLAIKDLVKKLKGDRIGLIAFAGRGFMVCPLTADYDGFLLTLESVDTETIPKGGTSVGEAIAEALRSYHEIASKHKALVIITDGEDLEGQVVEQAQLAKRAGIKVYTVGIGTQEGELIRLQNGFGESEFLKDNEGNYVKSRLNEKLLQEISLLTGGAYVRASGAQFGLDLIYDKYLSKLNKVEITKKMEKRYYERFQYPLLLALIFLIAETLLTNFKKRIKEA